MNNENKARIRILWLTVYVTLITLLFGINSEAQAAMKEVIVYNKNVFYVNKYTNLVNIKDVINIDGNVKKVRANILYSVSDIASKSTFLMPAYSTMLNLKSRVDERVIISRLANGLKSTETGGVGSYYRHSYSSSACGAYQYMPDTWNNYMGYKTACQAPEWVQDQRVIYELKFNFAKYHDWRKVVAAHLIPSRANNMATWNKPVPGNPTVSQYVNSVFKKANIALV